jgi:squalene-hopene/tetraprenyl-beta-curcumene cyclase
MATFESTLTEAVQNTRAHLLSLRNARGHWEGHLSNSALSTATAIVALHLVDAPLHSARIAQGVRWLVLHQNKDGGWGDTTLSKSNLSTTLLCWSALSLCEPDRTEPIQHCEAWIKERTTSLEPDVICRAVVARYGKDKTFSVPILMLCAIGGRLGPEKEAWSRVLALPFELAAMPREWFGAIGLPVVSYALPALIAIGYARFYHAPPSLLNPLHALRKALWPRISPMLKLLQPSTGGYLEATPLTSFVTMALASAGEKFHPCVPEAIRFLEDSQRTDGSWPIDTNLATWGTTLSTKALTATPEGREALDIPALKAWLLGQQYQEIHPFTNAAPGGWAWTDLPGGVPDADDTSGALVALWHLCEDETERRTLAPAVARGVRWLMDLQNRDGGIPTFCRGWGTQPFDRSTPEITAHALHAWGLWQDHLDHDLRGELSNRILRALQFIARTPKVSGSQPGFNHVPLWFGNEHATEEENHVYGTAQIMNHLLGSGLGGPIVSRILATGDSNLRAWQKAEGGWSGSDVGPASLEETAVAVAALAGYASLHRDQATSPSADAAVKGARWLVDHSSAGTRFPSAPIGLYFARLWYHEQLYPVIWTLGALQQVSHLLQSTRPSALATVS